MSSNAFKVLVSKLFDKISCEFLWHGLLVHSDTNTRQNHGCNWTLLACWGFEHLFIKYLLVPYFLSFKIQNLLDLCDSVYLSFSLTPWEVQHEQIGFCPVSSYNVINGYVGAIDGLLLVIKCSFMNNSENKPSWHYSGHYCCHGLTIQALYYTS